MKRVSIQAFSNLLSHLVLFNYECKIQICKGEKTKYRLKTGEMSDTYLTHVCRLWQSVDSLERIDKKKTVLLLQLMKAAGRKLQFFNLFFLDSLGFMVVCRHESLPFLT